MSNKQPAAVRAAAAAVLLLLLLPLVVPLVVLRCSLNHFLRLAAQRLSNLPMESQDGRDRMEN